MYLQLPEAQYDKKKNVKSVMEFISNQIVGSANLFIVPDNFNPFYKW